MELIQISRRLSAAVDRLKLPAGSPISHVYNPLAYAREPHERYLSLWGTGPKQVLLLGMNPGPFGMAQTGVPFGDVSMVRDFLGVTGRVTAPADLHPKRPIQGFDCTRAEVSGTRLWGWAKQRFGTAEAFFSCCFVVNYCPLVYMEPSGKNFTPDKLPVGPRDALFEVCDRALAEVAAELNPAWVVGVGAFAHKRAAAALAQRASAGELKLGTVLHPSPASPRANRGWADAADADFEQLGVAALFPPRTT